MGLTDPTDPGGEGDAVEIGGPLPAAPIEMARSGCAHVEPCAAQEAASEQGPGTGQGGVAAAAGRPPKAAGEESQDEPLVFGDDDEGLPAAKVAAAGATADPVKDYLKQIGRVTLLNAEQEVELAKRIEAGLFAEEKLGQGIAGMAPDQRIGCGQGRPQRHRADGAVRCSRGLPTGRGGLWFWRKKKPGCSTTTTSAPSTSCSA